MLREFVKASEAEIWTRVRSPYFTSFGGLHFENEPRLTELDNNNYNSQTISNAP